MRDKGGDRPQWQPTPLDRIVMVIEGLCILAQVALAVIFYNDLALTWLLWVGWAVLAGAIVLAWRARVAFQSKGEAEEGENWMQTRTVVDTGVYGLVRHPMYLSFMLISLAMVFLAQHWSSVVLFAIFMILQYRDMQREELNNFEWFGHEYVSYMRQVPRMNFVAGTIRLIRRQRAEEE